MVVIRERLYAQPVYPTSTVGTSLLVSIVSRLRAGWSGDRIAARAQDSSLPNRPDRL